MTRLGITKQTKSAQYFKENLWKEIELEMVLIPGGSFMMGTTDEEVERLVQEYEQEWFREEAPQHLVNVPSFCMGRFPITQGQWQAVANLDKVDIDLNSDPSEFKKDYKEISRWQRPVERVSWEEAKEFCARLTRLTDGKRVYRLPTEAEWEYAARAGTETPFHFGETISTDLANYSGNLKYGKGVEGEYRGQTTPVGYFKVANNFGLSDMHGNVWEWCEDDWHKNYDGAPKGGSAWVEVESNLKVIRGGSWNSYPNDCRSAYRNWNGR
ncbi:MAG: formylglycine-generating enzyme family protein, partial [Cyanobacteria bacterium J06642_3]